MRHLRPFAVVVLFAVLFGYPYYELTRYILAWCDAVSWNTKMVIELVALWTDYVLAFGLLAYFMIRRAKHDPS